jgi:hypothetical protein
MGAHVRRLGLSAFFLLAMGGAALAASAQFGAVHWDDVYQRWRDVVTNPYVAAKKTTRFYDQAAVNVGFDDSAWTFKGSITATNLKPNFAYQVKLNGKPTRFWGADGDDWANEQLGYNGRWWVDQYDCVTRVWLRGWNSTDPEYQYWKANDFADCSTFYVFQGYLLFDYVVTDASGAVSKNFALDSSLHVLWKTSVRTPTAKDTKPATFTISALASSGWYSRDYATKQVSLYGEWEPGRPLPGKVLLPPGNYNVRLFLTEESFHETAASSGSWATVMSNDTIAFSVDGTPAPVPPGVTLLPVTAGDAKTGGRYSITATVRNDNPDVPANVSLDCKVSGLKQQTLQRKSVNIPGGTTVKVTWTDSVGSGIKPGTYTAAVTLVGTVQSKVSNTFSVTK